MKFFVDTADIDEIRDLAATGLLDGVTTNPSLVAKTGRDFFEVLKDICAVVEGPVSAEVAATDADAMVTEGRKLAEIADNIAVKVPLIWDGLKACRALTQAGVLVNVTLCFSPSQAVLAAKAGASFVSPFVGAPRRHQPRRDGVDRGHSHHLRQLPELHDRDPGRLGAPPRPCRRGGATRRRHLHHSTRMCCGASPSTR